MSERRVPYTASVPRNRRRSQFDFEVERALRRMAQDLGVPPDDVIVQRTKAIINRAAARRRRGDGE